MTTKMRVVLQGESGLLAEVCASEVTFQTHDGRWVNVPADFFSDVVDTLIEVTGDDTYKVLEAQLSAETGRRLLAEAAVRALESQLAAMRALLQPKPVAKFSDTED